MKYKSQVREIAAHYGSRIPKYELEAMREILLAHIISTDRTGNFTSCSPAATREYLRFHFALKTEEEFVVMYLDAQHRLIELATEFYGTIDSCTVHIRPIVKHALELNAAAVILAHNHPSGVEEPSGADRAITSKLAEALQMIEVRVLDHMVIGAGRIASFAEKGWL